MRDISIMICCCPPFVFATKRMESVGLVSPYSFFCVCLLCQQNEMTFVVSFGMRTKQTSLYGCWRNEAPEYKNRDAYKVMQHAPKRVIIHRTMAHGSHKCTSITVIDNIKMSFVWYFALSSLIKMRPWFAPLHCCHPCKMEFVEMALPGASLVRWPRRVVRPPLPKPN